ARIRRSYKEGDDQDDSDEGRNRCKRQYFIEFEQRNRVVLLYRPNQRGVTLVHDFVQRRVTEYGKPQEGKNRRHKHHPEHELTDGAPTADFRNKKANKRRPGNRPAKNEQCPVTNPVAAAVCLQIKRSLDNVVEVAAGVLQKTFQNMYGGASDEYKGHQNYRQHHIQNGEPLHTLIQPGYHRQNRQAGDGGNSDNLHRDIYRDTRPQIINPGIDLRHRQTQSRGDAKHGAEHRKNIHRVTDTPENSLPNNRAKRRANGERQAVAKGKISQD